MTTCQCCGQALPENGTVIERLASVKLTRSERDIANMLQRAGGSCMTNERLIDGLWGDDVDGGPEDATNVVRTLICKMRPKIRAAGLVIDTVYKYGYALRVDEVPRS